MTSSTSTVTRLSAGMIAAFAYYELRVNRDVPTPVAIVLVVRVLTYGAPDPARPENSVWTGLNYVWQPQFSALGDFNVWLAAAGFIACAVVAWYWPTATLFCLPAILGALIIPAIDWIWRSSLKGSPTTLLPLCQSAERRAPSALLNQPALAWI